MAHSWWINRARKFAAQAAAAEGYDAAEAARCRELERTALAHAALAVGTCEQPGRVMRILDGGK